MTKARPYERCRHCGIDFLKPVKRAVFCSRECAAWSKVWTTNPEKCWPWQGALKGNGYGTFSYNGRTQYAHRAILEMTLGHALPRDTDTRHSCDNRACCNPDHLSAGSRSDNMRDCRNRGRLKAAPPRCQGERHGNSKLWEAAVREIRAGGRSDTEWADRFGISRQAVQKARTGATWPHL